MTIVTLGIDLGKTLCSIAGMDADGAVVLRRRVRRSTLVSLADKLAPCTVAMEACCGRITSGDCSLRAVMTSD